MGSELSDPAKIALGVERSEDLKLRAAELLERAEEARTRAEEMQQRMAIVAEVSRLLSESFDLPASLGRVARHLVDTRSRACVIEINDDEGRPAPLAVAHRNAAEEARMRDSFSRRRTAEEADTLITPIEAGGLTVGSMTLLGTSSSGGWDAEEREFVRDIGGRIGVFVERAGLYEEARRAISARDEFLSIAAHELRTPLTAMMLQIQALGRTLRKQGRQELSAEALILKIESAERQLGRLAQLIEALLDVSRISSRGLALDLEKTDLTKIAREVAGRFAEPAARGGGTITVEAERGVVGLWDPVRVEQVVVNLVSNAVKYGQNKPIEINVRGSDAVAELTVRDHGIGIAPENLERIFDRFERGVPAVSYGGLGLGLYIARQLVAAHGGTLGARSELGAWTVLTVRLPLVGRSRAELLDDVEEHADLDGFPKDA